MARSLITDDQLRASARAPIDALMAGLLTSSLIRMARLVTGERHTTKAAALDALRRFQATQKGPAQ